MAESWNRRRCRSCSKLRLDHTKGRATRAVDLSCSPNAHTRKGDRRRMVVPAQRGVNRMTLSLLGSATWSVRTSSERTFEQCVSPSPTATAATGSCTPRKSQVTTIRLMRGVERVGGRCSHGRARWTNPGWSFAKAIGGSGGAPGGKARVAARAGSGRVRRSRAVRRPISPHRRRGTEPAARSQIRHPSPSSFEEGRIM